MSNNVHGLQGDPAMRPDDTAFDLPPIPRDGLPPPSPTQQREVSQAMKREYGVMAWYGQATEHWWAYDGAALVEALDPKSLAEQLRRTRLVGL